MKKTIYDIAKDLKLAPSTVSKAINGGKGVSAKTTKKVLDYVEKVRFFPNTNASKLKTKKSYTIGVIFSEAMGIGLEHNFFSSIIQSFKDYVQRKGYEITFVINNLGNRYMSYYEYCQQKNIEGVFIVTSLPNDSLVDELINSNVHCVSTDIYREGLHTIISDNYDGSKKAVDYFVKKGYDRIAHIAGPKFAVASIERRDGFYQAMEKNSLEVEEDFVISVDHFSFEHGYAAAREYLKKENYPKAVYIVSDYTAMGFIKCLQDKGIRVPEDVSVIGFDDIPFSRHFTPELTTIKQDTYKLGVSAAEKLLYLMDSKTNDATGVEKVPVKLIKRDSVK